MPAFYKQKLHIIDHSQKLALAQLSDVILSLNAQTVDILCTHEQRMNHQYTKANNHHPHPDNVLCFCARPHYSGCIHYVTSSDLELKVQSTNMTIMLLRTIVVYIYVN